VRKISRSTVKNIPWEIAEDSNSLIARYKKEGYTLVGLEITEGSVAIQNANLSELSKVLLVCGSENYGISPEILSQLDVAIHIPMYGANSSMNVVNSLSILLYELTNQMKSRVL
jgi:tRNA G18 (ribose-2'-O)-methylase SpoU